MCFLLHFKKIERNGDKLKEEKTICGLYPRVSTEDQSRFGHNLDEQEEKLKQLCNFKDYEIYKVYRE